mmetsp:Transcript_13065/g.32007  ORF Transcript_13065/g.32007 Transcript_13065/m.32007 type:complete len:281 (-) Transcript_13065:258-1100(-)
MHRRSTSGSGYLFEVVAEAEWNLERKAYGIASQALFMWDEVCQVLGHSPPKRSLGMGVHLKPDPYNMIKRGKLCGKKDFGDPPWSKSTIVLPEGEDLSSDDEMFGIKNGFIKDYDSIASDTSHSNEHKADANSASKEGKDTRSNSADLSAVRTEVERLGNLLDSLLEQEDDEISMATKFQPKSPNQTLRMCSQADDHQMPKQNDKNAGKEKPRRRISKESLQQKKKIRAGLDQVESIIDSLASKGMHFAEDASHPVGHRLPEPTAGEDERGNHGIDDIEC